MNKKALSLAVYIALSYPGVSWGLGLGEIESASSLNQPFKAKINLLSVNGADIRNLNVKVASPSIFRRVGIDRPAYLNGLRFRSVMENGQPVIQVSSSQPVQEPFINFLLEVSWPKGQLLKEYTVLLDPPVLMQPGTSVASNTAGVRAEPTRAIQQPQRQQAAPAATNAQQTTRAQLQRQRIIAEQRQRDANAQRRQQALQQERQRAQAQAQRRGGAAPAPAQANDGLRRPGKPLSQQAAAATRNTNSSRTYRVRSGDTLYKVAAKVGYQGVRTEQMMMALFEANPTAFRKRNINNLKAGVDLRRPSINEAKRIGLSQARQQIRAQSSEWKAQRKTQVASTNKAPVTRDNKPSQVQPNGATENNKLVEVLGSTDNNNSANSGNLSGQSKVDNLNRQLTLASESLSARNRENDELQSRVSELESLLRKKNRLITLKNEQLAELQVSLGQPPTAMTGDDDQIADPIAATGEAISGAMDNNGESGEIIRAQDPQQAIISDSQQPEVFEAPVDPADTIDEVLEPQSPFVEKENGILDLISSPMVLGLGAGSLAALLLGFLFLRRRNAKDEYDDYSPIDFDDPSLAPGATDFENDSFTQNNTDPMAAGDDPFAGLGDNAEKVETPTNNFNVDPADELLEEPAAAMPAAKVAAPDDLDDGDDILQEADVYIVYGLHEQAEVELKKAIEKEPTNLEYRAKLLENYNASDNKEAFEVAATEFAQMEGATDSPLWDKVSGWGRKLLPVSPLFASPGVAAAIKDTASQKEGSGLGSKLGMAAGAAAVGGIAVSAGKAIADTTKDKLSDAGDAVTGAVDNLGVDVPSMDLPDLGGASVDAVADKATESLDFDAMDLDSMLSNDVEASADMAKPEIIDQAADNGDLDFDFSDFELDDAKDKVAELGESAEVPDLVEGLDVDDFSDLDLGLDDAKDNLLGDLDTKDLDVANLNLALDGSDNGVGKILPESSVYKMSGDVKSESSADILGDLDDDLSFLNLGDDDSENALEGQVSTKLDLARAYIDMGDVDGARGTLEEVLMEGNDAQRKEAEELLHKAG